MSDHIRIRVTDSNLPALPESSFHSLDDSSSDSTYTDTDSDSDGYSVPASESLADRSETTTDTSYPVVAPSAPQHEPRQQQRKEPGVSIKHTHRTRTKRIVLPSDHSVDESFTSHGHQPFPAHAHPHHYTHPQHQNHHQTHIPQTNYPPQPPNIPPFNPNPFVAPNPPHHQPHQPGRMERLDMAQFGHFRPHDYAAGNPRHSYYGQGQLPPAPLPYHGAHDMMPYAADQRYNYAPPYMTPFYPALQAWPRPHTSDSEPAKASSPILVVDPAIEAKAREVEARAKDLEATIKALQKMNDDRVAADAASQAAARKAEEDALNAKLLRLEIETKTLKAREEAEAKAKADAEEILARQAETKRTVAEEVMKAKIEFEEAAAKAKAAKAAADQAEADAKVAAEASYKAAVREAEEKLRAEAEKKAKEEAEKAAAAPKPEPPKEKPKPIRFKDAVGRKFSFPFHLCSTWAGMEDLIMQAFLHVEEIGDHVAAGRYDLIGPNGEIILPPVWETMIEPDWSITMVLWPIPPKPEPPMPEFPGMPPRHGKRPKGPPVPPAHPGGVPGGLPPGVTHVTKKPSKKKPAGGGFFDGLFGPARNGRKAGTKKKK